MDYSVCTANSHQVVSSHRYEDADMPESGCICWVVLGVWRCICPSHVVRRCCGRLETRKRRGDAQHGSTLSLMALLGWVSMPLWTCRSREGNRTCGIVVCVDAGVP